MKQFILELTKILSSGGNISKTDELFNQLLAEEKRFIEIMSRNNRHKLIFQKFIDFLSNEKDIRSARSYFREREGAFKNEINKSIKNKKYDALLKYKYNFLFFKFAMEHYKNPPNSLKESFEAIKRIRQELIQLYLHYCLNRAKVFSKYASNINDFSDFLQAAHEGLVVAVDKYVPDKNASPFYTVAIGRMTANLINLSTASEAVHLGSSASRKLYRIKRLMEFYPNLKPEEISEFLEIDIHEVLSILNATNSFSLDSAVCNANSSSDSNAKLIDILPDLNDKFNVFLENDQLVKIYSFFLKELSVLEQKILRLKGIPLKKIEKEIEDRGICE